MRVVRWMSLLWALVLGVGCVTVERQQAQPAATVDERADEVDEAPEEPADETPVEPADETPTEPADEPDEPAGPPPGCDLVGFAPELSTLDAMSFGETFWREYVELRFPTAWAGDELQIELEDSAGLVGPGTYDLSTSLDYPDTVVFLEASLGCPTSGPCDAHFVARAGTLVLTESTAHSLSGHLHDVELVEVEYDYTFESIYTPIEDGEVWCLDEHAIGPLNSLLVY